MKTKTIQELKDKLKRAKPGCCFTGMELLLLHSLLPKQEYEEGEKIMISCAFPLLLINLIKHLVHSEKIESSSFLWRLALQNYFQTGWVPFFPKIASKKLDYSFRVTRSTWKKWKTIQGNKTKILESWGWFLAVEYVDKLPAPVVYPNFILID
jgi:hypothetical protein